MSTQWKEYGKLGTVPSDVEAAFALLLAAGMLTEEEAASIAEIDIVTLRSFQQEAIDMALHNVVRSGLLPVRGGLLPGGYNFNLLTTAQLRLCISALRNVTSNGEAAVNLAQVALESGKYNLANAEEVLAGRLSQAEENAG